MWTAQLQFLIVLVMSILFIGCKSNGSDVPAGKQSVLVKASGLAQAVDLIENVNNTSHTITQDGNHELIINEGIYLFEVMDSGGQNCHLNNELDLVCADVGCGTDYTPVCAKKPFVNVCVTAPCTTDVYQTFSNACNAVVQNAWVTFQSECGNLENIAALHTEPVILVPIAVTDYLSDSFELISSEITNDTLTIVTEVGGGCGTHDVTVYVDNVISLPTSNPPQIAIGISHLDHDDCEALTQVSSSFDLLPVKENYRRLFPEASGVIQVGLNELGVYEFEL